MAAVLAALTEMCRQLGERFYPLGSRRTLRAAPEGSFKEFMQEWILDQYVKTLAEFGMKKPWYWDTFIDSLDIYHHMVYASAYTYRATAVEPTNETARTSG